SATLTPATFTLTGPGVTAVPGTVTYTATGFVATFTPTSPLAPSTLFTATITTGAQDQASPANAVAAKYVWTFTTAPLPVVVVPTVTASSPLNGATGVALNQVLSVTFSEAMNCATLSSPATTFTLTGPGATSVPGTVSCNGSIATFAPTGLFATNTLFTATITTGAKDPAGSALASNFVWTFRTVPAPTAPTVLSVFPANNATGVALNQAVGATFSAAMNP